MAQGKAQKALWIFPIMDPFAHAKSAASLDMIAPRFSSEPEAEAQHHKRVGGEASKCYKCCVT